MNKISDVLLELRVRPNLRGYKYLQTAVELVLEDWNRIYKLRVMYQEIAEIYDVTPESVWRAMRYAVASRDSTGKDLSWCLRYGRVVNVGAFLALAAEKIKGDKQNETV